MIRASQARPVSISLFKRITVAGRREVLSVQTCFHISTEYLLPSFLSTIERSASLKQNPPVQSLDVTHLYRSVYRHNVFSNDNTSRCCPFARHVWERRWPDNDHSRLSLPRNPLLDHSNTLCLGYECYSPTLWTSGFLGTKHRREPVLLSRISRQGQRQRRGLLLRGQQQWPRNQHSDKLRGSQNGHHCIMLHDHPCDRGRLHEQGRSCWYKVRSVICVEDCQRCDENILHRRHANKHWSCSRREDAGADGW